MRRGRSRLLAPMRRSNAALFRVCVSVYGQKSRFFDSFRVVAAVGSWHVSPLVIESSKQASLGTKPRNYLKLIKIYVYRAINVSVAPLLSAWIQLIDFQLQHSVGNARTKMNIKNHNIKCFWHLKMHFPNSTWESRKKALNGPWISLVSACTCHCNQKIDA